MEIPEQHYDVIAKLPSAEFQKICREPKEFGETLQLSGSNEDLSFQVTGSVLQCRRSRSPEVKV